METYSSEEIRKAIDKVRKLLALVGNNDSPAQIQAALMKVQELQAKYGFHVSELQSEEEVEVITVSKDSQLSLIKSSSARMSVKDDYAQAQGYRDGKFVGGSYGKSGYLH